MSMWGTWSRGVARYLFKRSVNQWRVRVTIKRVYTASFKLSLAEVCPAIDVREGVQRTETFSPEGRRCSGCRQPAFSRHVPCPGVFYL